MPRICNQLVKTVKCEPVCIQIHILDIKLFPIEVYLLFASLESVMQSNIMNESVPTINLALPLLTICSKYLFTRPK